MQGDIAFMFLILKCVARLKGTQISFQETLSAVINDLSEIS